MFGTLFDKSPSLFRNKLGQFMGCFAEGLASGNSLAAELCGAMRTI